MKTTKFCLRFNILNKTRTCSLEDQWGGGPGVGNPPFFLSINAFEREHIVGPPIYSGWDPPFFLKWVG